MEKKVKSKFQPVMLIFDRRLECSCGALAIIVTGEFSEEERHVLKSIIAWCQDCYQEIPDEED